MTSSILNNNDNYSKNGIISTNKENHILYNDNYDINEEILGKMEKPTHY
jgi:hypothetical protein